MGLPDLSSTPRTVLRRHHDRARTDREDLYAVLDAGLICHLGPSDEPADYAADVWAGVVPVTGLFGEPESDAALRPGFATPEHIRRWE